MPKQLKIIVIGDSGVGKTALITRIISSSFRKSYVPTIGVEIMCYQDGNYVYNFWDFAGNPKFAPQDDDRCYGKADAVIAVYDITSDIKTQLHQLMSRINDVKLRNSQSMPIFLVTTKSDGSTQKLPESLLSCSSKTGDGISILREKLSNINI
jgi:small GTP-binding protein